MKQSPHAVTVEARPQPMTIDPGRTAVIVVDMQNDFGHADGMFGRAGIPLAGIQAVVEPTARVLDAARRADMPVVYLKMEFSADLSDAGGPDAPNLLKHRALNVGAPVVAPDGSASRVLIRDTWNTDFLPELTPHPGDIIVSKHRYSGFFETNLDAVLREAGVTALIFTGCTTSVCVEGTLRDAFYRDYRCLLLSDCTAEPRGTHVASLLTIETLFGWVTDSGALLGTLAAQPVGVTTS